MTIDWTWRPTVSSSLRAPADAGERMGGFRRRHPGFGRAATALILVSGQQFTNTHAGLRQLAERLRRLDAGSLLSREQPAHVARIQPGRASGAHHIPGCAGQGDGSV